MDVYHKVLTKLFDVTGGKESQVVDFKDLVKKMEFHGNYGDIFEQLSREGWIAESKKANFVSITHWGVAEAKKCGPPDKSDEEKEPSANQELSVCVSAAKEFAAVMEDLAKDFSKENFKKAETKFAELEKSFRKAVL